MKVIDPGHEYLLDSLDGDQENRLVFVKRIGAKYPGNESPAHAGTTMQEVLRACRDRAIYVNAQMPCLETSEAIEAMSNAIYAMERRAARYHGREKSFMKLSRWEVIVGVGKCQKCGHVGCDGGCH